MKRPFPSHDPRSRQGMVLLEVLTALGVFVLVAMPLLMALDASMDSAQERNEIDAAMRGVQNQFALLHASPFAPVDKDLPDDKSGIAYHLKIEPVQLQDQKRQPVTGIYRVTVTATWKSNGQTDDRSIDELIYQP